MVSGAQLRFGSYVNRPVLRAVLWTLLLAPVAILLQVTALVLLPFALWFGRKRNPEFSLDTIFGEQIADVSNYVAAAAGATRPGSSVANAAALVQQRVVDAVRAANSAGPKRIVIVAHSLGTVIAYHALAGNLGPPIPIEPFRVSVGDSG